MKVKNEFQGNKGIIVLQCKNLKNAIVFKILQHEELMQIKGGDEVGGEVIANDID
ncbi:MAG: bacteriocin [Bacteroidales bacterium]|nr:bacteriocin [Bacteroidales bacterium]